MKTGAIIICGGLSRRMGEPKASLRFGPERLLERIVRLVGQSSEPIVVVAAPGQPLPDLPHHVKIARDALGGRGPLQALHAGLVAIGDDVPLAYATSTDAPFLAPGWIDRLANLLGEADLGLPVIGAMSYPLAALYRRSTSLTAIRSLLDRDILRLKSLIPLLRVREVGADDLRDLDPNFASLVNLNTPEDYRQALAQAGFL